MIQMGTHTNWHVILLPRTQDGNDDVFENLCTNVDLEKGVSLCTTGACLVPTRVSSSCDPHDTLLRQDSPLRFFKVRRKVRLFKGRSVWRFEGCFYQLEFFLKHKIRVK